MFESNPLLLPYDLPPFSAIRAEHLVPGIEQIISEGRLAVAAIIASQTPFPTWDDLVLAMEYQAELAANNDLYQLYRQLASSPIAALFNEQRKSALHKILRKYHLAGLELSADQQLRLTQLNQEIDTASQEFLDRVEDSARAWRKHIEDPSLLTGGLASLESTR